MVYPCPPNNQELYNLINSCVNVYGQGETEVMYTRDDLIADVYLELQGKPFTRDLVFKTIRYKVKIGYKMPVQVTRCGLFEHAESFDIPEYNHKADDPKVSLYDMMEQEFINLGIDDTIEVIRKNRGDISLAHK